MGTVNSENVANFEVEMGVVWVLTVINDGDVI